MTADEIIDGILQREGSGYTNHPADRGGPTKYGITLATLRRWRSHTVVTTAMVEALTEDEARAIYDFLYIQEPGFTPARIPNEAVRAAVIDDGVLSGPRNAVLLLQRALALLGAHAVAADGILGPITTAAVELVDPDVLLKQLVRGRLVRYARLCQAEPAQVVFLVGWIERALVFLP